MTAVTALAVQELRRRSGAGMMDCKTALMKSAGDMEKAADLLRARGLAAAVKNAGRAASQGGIGLACDGRAGALLELNCETDFVARNARFLQFAGQLAQLALAQTDERLEPQAFAALAWPHGGGGTVADALNAQRSALGENLVLRRLRRMEGSAPGLMGFYMHNELGMRRKGSAFGQIGVLVSLRSAVAHGAQLTALARQLAMHIAANAPLAVAPEQMEAGLVERERAVYRAKAEREGKPEQLRERIVDGGLRKFYAESVLLQQPFVLDPDRRVQAVLAEQAQALGGEIAVAGFVRWMLGEDSDSDGAAAEARPG